MKVLVVGGGGREHAICWKLAQSPKITELYCAPGNAGIADVATCVNVKATDVEGMVKWAKDNAMDFVMVAPDDPLALGMVDAMDEAGIPAFGPRANAAIIEASKAFSKALMKKYNIPTAAYEISPSWTRLWLTLTSRALPSWSRPTAWLWARASWSPPPWRRPSRLSAR